MVSTMHGAYGPAELERLTTALDQVIACRGLPVRGPHRQWLTRRLIDALDEGDVAFLIEISRLSRPPH